jgi:hypothetical protein
MDELKKYIQNHAEELDLDEPGPQVWDHIRQQSQVAKKRPVIMMVTRWAAAACILALAGIGVWHMISTKKADQLPLAGKTKETIVIPAPVQEEPGVTKHNEPDVIATTTGHTNKRKSTISNPQQLQKNEAGETLHNLESSFTQVINLQRERVSKTPMYAESPEYFNDFKIQIRQMERDEKVIKSDIAKRGMNDELLGQLINLYQQKLNTLKQLQTEMNKTNMHYKQNRGPADSTKTYYLNL